MDTQDIVKSLSKLERSLKGVDSARQQVEKTIAAYDATCEQVNTLLQEIANVSNDLSAVVDIVKKNQKQLTANLSDKTEQLFAQIDSKVEIIGDKATEMNQAFETNCIEISKSINGEFDAAIASFKEKVQHELSGLSSLMEEFKTMVKDIKEGFKNDTSKAISTLQETGDKIISVFQAKIEDYLISFSKLKDELDSVVNRQKTQNDDIISKIEAEASVIKAAVSDMGSRLDIHHKELVDVLSAILQGNNPSAEKLTARFNTVDGSIGAVKEGVSSVSTQLGTATSQIIDNNKQALLSEVTEVKAENAKIKKLLMICLIAIVVLVILNVVKLFA